MAFTATRDASDTMSDINITPLVDVMLVLLIIFLIAVPVAIQTIEKLEIPVFESLESMSAGISTAPETRPACAGGSRPRRTMPRSCG